MTVSSKGKPAPGAVAAREPTRGADAGARAAVGVGRLRLPAFRTGLSRRYLSGAIVVVLLAGISAGGWFASQYWRHRQADHTRTEAVAAARQAMLNFVEINPRALDAGMQRVAEAATGDFKTEYEKDRAKLKQAYAQNKLEARGEVLDAGVVASDPDSVTVLLVVDQTVRKDKSGQPQLRHYRIQVDMVSERGRWLVSTLAFVS